MHISPRSAPYRVVVSLILSHAVVISLLAPPQSSLAMPAETGSSGAASAKLLQDSTAQRASWREGELLVRFRGGVSQAAKDVLLAAHGARLKKRLQGESGVEKLELPRAADPVSVALQFNSNPSVEFAEANFLVKSDQVSATPNDERFSEQWALSNTGQNGGQFGSDINVTRAWQITTGLPTTVIAVIDSGIDFTHPDLVGNQWTNPMPINGDTHGWDFTTGNGEIKDEQGHGTAVAGIIAAHGNNAIGVAGVMWRASLMSLRVLDNTGTGDIAMAVEAIDYAVAHGAQVINISWGTNGESIALKDAIQRALRRNVVVVCSAGNGSRSLDTAAYYPASYGLRDLIAVAATDNFDQLASWSNWGTGVTVAAPGTKVLTTRRGGGYGNVSGTSAAAPMVTGVAGLMKSARPMLSTRSVAKAISDEARQVASLSGKIAAGGVVNASGAVATLQGSVALPMPIPTPVRGSGGTGPGGSFSTTPPSRTTGAASNLPNLDQIRNNNPQQPKAKEPIESNQPCLDCEPGGGGGGGYYPPGDPDFSTARELPRNETGTPGVNLGSRNFNWSLPLVGLPGRAGLDLNLTLYYNSLVWTKDGSYIKYNADGGAPAPGFRLGFPTLQQRFLNSQTGIYAYMLVTPSGGRVELRQVGGTNIYESQDGSYTQLDMSNPAAPLVRTTDGTQLSFIPVSVNNEYRCTQIKDRNGNFISASYDTSNGHLLTVTDTLGRVINFVYDGSSNLTAITQTWAGVTHYWATFYYGSVYLAPNFGGGLIVNGPNNSYVPVLTQVNLHDGSYFTFNYNSAFGQVNRINRYAADGHMLSYTSYNLDGSAGQTDCPRFTERRDWGEYGVMNQSQEVVTSYAVAADGSWSQQTAPDGTIYKEFFYITGWQSGLSYQSEVWSGGVRQKWTTTGWTQDDTSLSYQKNARPYDISTYDQAGNRRRIDIIYSSYSLPGEIREYSADGSGYGGFIRRTYIDYNFNPAYIDRRIIGLKSAVHVVDENNQYVSKVTYEYDWDNSTNTYLINQGAATQHDGTNYSQSFIGGRGNLCAVRRWNVNAITDWNQAMWVSFTGYNTTGSVIFTADGLGHETRFGYGDSFSDGVNRSTFAYPTTVTDPDNFSSTAQYNYDFGAVTRTQDPKGAVQTMSYDSAARISQTTNAINNAYMRWVYPTAMNYVQRFARIQDGAGEAYSADFFDGWGKVRASASDHPGSAGEYSAVHVMYDAMGRMVWSSNPTEITSGWVPSGDDAAGWVWTYQNYDWKGRPRVTTNPDGTTRENIYGGCGCAGGEVTTARDENGRRRKLTTDVLGRLKQVDELNWDQSIYSTTIYNFNARDQIASINQAGQTRSFLYDGHGRLQHRITPEQGTTTYSYFGDDAVQTTTDARGATTNFSYNNRGLVTNITYGAAGGATATSNASFGYDAAGNPTSMTDGLGSMSYIYNTLSQLTSETRTFNGLGSYTLSYAYNLGGEVTSITNPWGAQVGYGYDKTGRLTNVSGSGYAGISNYASAVTYRAFGVKGISYGNSRQLSINYDNKLRMTRWDVAGVLGSDYEYRWEDTFRPTFAHSGTDATLDRWFVYDQVGRLFVSRSGSEARAAYQIEPFNGQYDGPYSMGIYYDVWGNITQKEGWGGTIRFETSTYTNNRRDGLQYDAAGNVINDGGQAFSYDVTGQQTTASYSGYLLQQDYDGNGLRARKTENGVTTYYLRSSVLGGQIVAEMNSSGAWTRGFVYQGSSLLAVQQSNAVYWMHEDPVTKSKRVTDINGTVVSTVELDPWGGETTRSGNAAFQPKNFTSYHRDANHSDEAMFRRYNRWWSRFDQPDPYDGSYDLTDPQSLNRYTYAQSDPVNFVDPSGLLPCAEGEYGAWCGGGGYWGPRGFDFTRGWTSDPRPGQNTVIPNFLSDPRYIVYTWWEEGDDYLRYFNLTPFLRTHDSQIFGGFHSRSRDVAALIPLPLPTQQNLRTIKQTICSAIPSGRTTGASGTLGLLGGSTGGVELVRNYNSGQVSAFAFGGGQVGWNGGASGSLYAGNVYGLNNSSSNYAGGFTSVNGSGRVVGGFVSRGGGVSVVGASANASLVGPINFGLARTKYTNPLQLGKFWAFDERDFAFFLTRQVVCR